MEKSVSMQAVELKNGLHSWIDQVRLDRNLFLNLPDINRSFNDDATLAKDIIVFMAHRYKADIFGYTSFNLNDFCATMKYKKPNLSKLHPLFEDPNNRPPMIEGYEFKSTFDYVMYQLAANNVPLSSVKSTQIPTLKAFNVSFIQIISDIKIVYDTRKPQNKIYSLSLGRGFMENLINFYVSISLTDYISVASNKHSGRIRNLYVYLAGMLPVLIYNKNTVLTPNFEMLCGIAGIEDKEPKHRKQRLIKYLETIRNNTTLKFDPQFIVGKDQKQAYTINLTFDMSNVNVESIKKNMYFKNIYDSFKEAYCKRFPDRPDDFENFQNWLTDRENDQAIKDKVIRDAHRQTYMNSEKDVSEDQQLQFMMSEFLQNLKK
jgi:hypothetical protein